jgi:hypothetical protein
MKPHVERLRGFLIKELTGRDNGTVLDGQLVSQKDKSPQISPHYIRRFETSDYKW